MTGYAQYKKLPAAKLGVLASGLFFLLGGVYIAIGLWVDLGALLLAITLILAGAALILFALIAFGSLTEFGPSVGSLNFFNF